MEGILRRPDNDCEPVLVKGKRLIWNRFSDISYEKDISIIRPWVNRRDPFPGMALGLPPSARDLLDAQKEFDITLELYHDHWTCPMRDLSLDSIKESEESAKKLGLYYSQRYDRPWGEPERIGDEPGMGHGSCWRVLVKTPHSLTPELRELEEVRLTDAQAMSLLSSQELVYQSRMSKEWTTHTFKIDAIGASLKEICESWRLRTMLNEFTGRDLDPSWYGVSQQIPDHWSPFFTINTDNIVIGLRHKKTGRKEEQHILERNIAIRSASEVCNILEQEMKKLLEKTGISIDRHLNSAIRMEIEACLSIYHVKQNGTRVVLDSVQIRSDKMGGRVIYAILVSEEGHYSVPLTRHLHDYRGWKVDIEEFAYSVESALDEYNLSPADKDEIVRKCLNLMRKERLVRK